MNCSTEFPSIVVPPFIEDVPIKPPCIGEFPLPCLNTRGYIPSILTSCASVLPQGCQFVQQTSDIAGDPGRGAIDIQLGVTEAYISNNEGGFR